MVARLHRTDAVTCVRDHTGGLVAHDEGAVAGPVPRQDVQIGVAHPGSADVDLDLARSGGPVGDLAGVQSCDGVVDEGGGGGGGGGEVRGHQRALTSSVDLLGVSRVWGLATAT